jgi:hypothetical protein
MAIQPTLAGPTVTSVQIGEPLNFVLFVSASANYTLNSVKVIVSGGADSGACSAAVSPVYVGLPLGTSLLNTSTTGTYPFTVVLHGPTTGTYGAAGSQQVLGSGVFGVSCICFESTTPANAVSNTVYVTASSVK